MEWPITIAGSSTPASVRHAASPSACPSGPSPDAAWARLRSRGGRARSADSAPEGRRMPPPLALRAAHAVEQDDRRSAISGSGRPARLGADRHSCTTRLARRKAPLANRLGGGSPGPCWNVGRARARSTNGGCSRVIQGHADINPPQNAQVAWPGRPPCADSYSEWPLNPGASWEGVGRGFNSHLGLHPASAGCGAS